MLCLPSWRRDLVVARARRATPQTRTLLGSERRNAVLAGNAQVGRHRLSGRRPRRGVGDRFVRRLVHRSVAVHDSSEGDITGNAGVHAVKERRSVVAKGDVAISLIALVVKIVGESDVERRDLHLVRVGALALHAVAHATRGDVHASRAVSCIDQQRAHAAPTCVSQVGDAACIAGLVRAIGKFAKFVVHIRWRDTQSV